ncbi:hypothetical protein GCM10010245_86930 [Streptomyces spectabilis]|uniref:Uncharacterized protein n=1 Tax=Streptomyces spectabilis TaxID=68270 RepID=A0A7W8EZX4_STRST|nr:hypothetical protein [Streptomyces spectabilis]GGV54934.1 hypothetical protein GCM10010245_86930 [Streptomyces spectabilis]
MTLAASPGTTSTTAFSVALPEPFTPEWSRIDGLTVRGNTITVDPGRYFFRYENPTWLLADWDLVRTELLSAAAPTTRRRCWRPATRSPCTCSATST